MRDKIGQTKGCATCMSYLVHNFILEPILIQPKYPTLPLKELWFIDYWAGCQAYVWYSEMREEALGLSCMNYTAENMSRTSLSKQGC